MGGWFWGGGGGGGNSGLFSEVTQCQCRWLPRSFVRQIFSSSQASHGALYADQQGDVALEWFPARGFSLVHFTCQSCQKKALEDNTEMQQPETQLDFPDVLIPFLFVCLFIYLSYELL